MVLQLWEVALVMLLLVLTVLALLLIPTILDLKRALSKISILAENLNHDLPDILHNISRISGQASRAGEKLGDAVEDLVEIERKISKEVKQPLLETAGTIAGILRGAQAFFTYFIKKHKK